MTAAISDLLLPERLAIADWVGERPDTVLAVDALLSGHGRVWINGEPTAPSAALIESALVPGEPQAFGDPDALLGLLERADRWTCVEVAPDLAEAISADFERQWGPTRRVVDVIHTLDRPIEGRVHPMVRQLSAEEARDLPTMSPDVLPDRHLAVRAAEHGRVFAAIDGDGMIVGHGSSMAAGRTFADVGVHVAGQYRQQGIATAAASQACNAVQMGGLRPVWGTGAHNAASLRVAAKLGFVEQARLAFLVRGDT